MGVRYFILIAFTDDEHVAEMLVSKKIGANDNDGMYKVLKNINDLVKNNAMASLFYDVEGNVVARYYCLHVGHDMKKFDDFIQTSISDADAMLHNFEI